MKNIDKLEYKDEDILLELWLEQKKEKNIKKCENWKNIVKGGRYD